MQRLIVAMLLALVLAPAAARAAPPTFARGTFSVEVVSNVQRQAGPNGPCIGTITTALTYDGTLTGKAAEVVRYVSHGPCDTSAPTREELQIDGTFTGQVDDRSGSFNYRAVFFFAEDGAGHGALVIQHGRDGLEGLHGVLHLAFNPATGAFSYAGRIHVGA